MGRVKEVVTNLVDLAIKNQNLWVVVAFQRTHRFVEMVKEILPQTEGALVTAQGYAVLQEVKRELQQHYVSTLQNNLKHLEHNEHWRGVAHAFDTNQWNVRQHFWQGSPKRALSEIESRYAATVFPKGTAQIQCDREAVHIVLGKRPSQAQKNLADALVALGATLKTDLEGRVVVDVRR